MKMRQKGIPHYNQSKGEQKQAGLNRTITNPLQENTYKKN